MSRMRLGKRIILLASACVLIAAGSAWSAKNPPTPPESTSHRIVVVKVQTPAPTSKSDSIYATEITVDMSGVTIVDRDGHRRHLAAGLPGIEIPEGIPGVPEPPNVVVSGDKDVRQEDLVRLTSDVTVTEDEVVRGDVVCVFGGQADIKGEVTGSVISVFGSINVDGSVGRDVVAPFGQVHIGPSGTVRHNVVASDIVKEPGGRVGGTREEIPLNLFGRRSGVPQPGLGMGWNSAYGISPTTTLTVLVLLNIVFWMFLVLLAHALAARNVAKVKDKIQRSFFKSFFMGILAEILLIPACLLLMVTIIGIPVALFLVPLMIAAAIVLAQASTGLLVGEKIDQNTPLALRSPLTRTLTGFLALQSISLVAVAAMWVSGNRFGVDILRLISFGLFGLTILLAYVVMTVGAGAVVMTRFGTRPKEAVPVTASEPGSPGSDANLLRAPTPLPHVSSDSSDTAPAVG